MENEFPSFTQASTPTPTQTRIHVHVHACIHACLLVCCRYSMVLYLMCSGCNEILAFI